MLVLFVGGPMDGEHHPIPKGGHTFRVTVAKSFDDPTVGVLKHSEFADYKLQLLRDSIGQEYKVMVYDGDNVIAKLLERYRPPPPLYHNGATGRG